MHGLANSSSRSEVRDFLERASEALLTYDDLDRELPASAPTTFTRSARQVDDALDRYQEPLRLAVVGEFNAGKSTLINALLGRPGLLLEGVTATTGSRTELWWGETEDGEVIGRDGEVIFSGPIERVRPYTDQRTPEGRSVAGKGVRIVLRVDSELLRNIVVIDTPGLGASASDDAATLDSLYLADVALLVVNGLQPGGEDSLTLTERLRSTKRRILVVVSRLDQVADAEESLTAAKSLLRDIADGDPMRVVAPAAAQALSALRTAERSGDTQAAEEAHVTLAASGYDVLSQRLADELVIGDAAARRAITTLSVVTRQLTQLIGSAAQISGRIEADAERAREEMSAAQRRIRDRLLPKKPFLAHKIDETVDIHVGAFINDLADAVGIFIDKIARGGISLGLRKAASVLDRDRSRFERRLQREFEDLFSPGQLDITIEQITESVQILMETEWAGATIDLSEDIGAGRFQASGLVRQITGDVSKLSGALAADLAAFIMLLFVPGGILIDVALLFLFSGASKTQRKRLDETISLAKREARNRIRQQRRELVHGLGKQYKEINTRTAEELIQKATDLADSQQTEHAALLKSLARWTAATEDLQALLDSADQLAGGGA